VQDLRPGVTSEGAVLQMEGQFPWARRCFGEGVGAGTCAAGIYGRKGEGWRGLREERRFLISGSGAAPLDQLVQCPPS